MKPLVEYKVILDIDYILLLYNLGYNEGSIDLKNILPYNLEGYTRI